jgi:hypothetical protein
MQLYHKVGHFIKLQSELTSHGASERTVLPSMGASASATSAVSATVVAAGLAREV